MTVTRVAARSQPVGDQAPTTLSTRAQMIAVGWFFGLSLALALASSLMGAPAAVLPFILALGPTVIALALAWREGHGALGRLRRSVTLRPPSRRWYLVLGLPIAWAFATVGIAVLLGEPTSGLFDNVFPAVAIIFLVVLLPAFAEEVAWRGFALPRLMTVMSPLRAALLIGIPWTLIHVGLFLPGQSNGELLLWPLGLGIVSYSIILTWLFVRTGGSVLMTALVHAGLNAMSPVMAGVDLNTQWIVRNVLAVFIALAVVGLGGFRRTTTLLPELDSAIPNPHPSHTRRFPMNRFFGIFGGALLALLILVPVAAAADPSDRDEHLILSNRGDITLAADQHADLLIVIDGTATIEGDTGSVVVINGTANFIGSSTGGILAVRSDVTLDDGSAASGEIVTFDSNVDAAAGASMQATVTDLAKDLGGVAVLAGAALFFVYLAFAISAIAAGLAFAGLASKQVREAGALIYREPFTSLLAGLGGLIGIVIVGTLAVVTVVGLPIGLGILVLVLPAMLIAGYVVAGIWIGDMILARMSPGVVRERPYLAALIGLAALGVIGILPVVGGIVTLIGFGAVVLLMWRTLRRPSQRQSLPATAAAASTAA